MTKTVKATEPLNIGTICAEQINRLQLAENLNEVVTILNDAIDHFFGLKKIDQLEIEMKDRSSLFKKLKASRLERKENFKVQVFKFLKKQVPIKFKDDKLFKQLDANLKLVVDETPVETLQ
jgi:oligoribonuclease (3'-5' exoribonuclease)